MSSARRTTNPYARHFAARYHDLGGRLLDWPEVCANLSVQGRSNPAATSDGNATRPTWRLDALAEAGSPLSDHAMRTGIHRLLAELHATRSLCDATAPCQVKRIGRESIRIVLPPASQQSRICEPFGDLWQSVGTTIGGTGLTFNIGKLARWWRKIRSPAALPPFLRGSGVDNRTRSLLNGKRTVEDDGRNVPRYRAALERLVGRQGGLPVTHGMNASRPWGPLMFNRCAVVGSGPDLRCGRPRGRDIDSADAVFRANVAQMFGLPYRNIVGVALGKVRITPKRAGRRTTFRVNCMFRNAIVGGAYRGEETCVVSRRWWALPWGREIFNNAHYTCCEYAVRSNYNVSRIEALTRTGGRFVWFGGDTSGEPILDAMHESSGGNALQAALALCQRVDVYGVGLLALRGISGPKTYSHYFDKEVGDCLVPGSNESAATIRRHVARVKSRNRRGALARMNQSKLAAELLWHILAAFGAIRWIKT